MNNTSCANKEKSENPIEFSPYLYGFHTSQERNFMSMDGHNIQKPWSVYDHGRLPIVA